MQSWGTSSALRGHRAQEVIPASKSTHTHTHTHTRAHTRSNNTDKSGRQTANATKHMQQQHERLFVVAFAPKNVYNSVFASRACNHYTAETRAKSFARRSFRLAYRQFFGRSLRRDELAMSALHQSRIAIQTFSSAAKIGLKILMMAAAS